MALKIEKTKVFSRIDKAFKACKRVIINVGGTGSGKTYATLQYIILLALTKKRDIIIARESMPVLRDSAMKDFFEILKNMEFYSHRLHNKTSNKYIFPNGSEVKFLGIDEADKLKGIKSDIVFIDEANNVSLQHYNQLTMRCNETVFLGYNPSSIECWIDDIAAQEDNILFHSTYKDNRFMPEARKKSIEDLIKTDHDYYLIYALGQKPEAQSRIYTHFKRYKVLPDRVPDNITYGMDVGFTNPTTIIKTYHYGNIKYVEEILYKSRIELDEIMDEINALDLDRRCPLYVDSASPGVISLLQRNRYNAIKANKEVLEGITSVKLCEVYVHENSTNLWTEYNKYSWKDKTTKDEPIKEWDHCLDGLRYSIHSVEEAYNPNRFKVRVG